ncbi:methyltransferase-like protein 27 [Lycodopsis pacificus]
MDTDEKLFTFFIPYAVVLGYDAASHEAKSISFFFSGDREAAVVLDVACGTGLVTKRDDSGHFWGIDGSTAMLEEAQKKGLYQDLKQSILGEQLLPVQRVGYVGMACRESVDNLEYKAALERELKQMEEEGLWSCVAVTEVENWHNNATTR